MSLIHFLPGVVKELVKHVPDLALEVTDWDGVLRDLPVLSRRLLTGAGASGLIEAQQKLPGNLVHFTSRIPASGTPPSREKNDAILRWYFAQLHCPEGLFVDLRGRHFEWKNHRLEFHPSGFWYRFTEDFRNGILTLYQGFYRGDEQRFEEGLVATGLLDRSWPAAEQSELKMLFRSHFGNSLEHPMRFTLAGFQESFLRIFQFLLRKKVRLSSEFMVFGIYLVTLYLALEEGGHSHAVKSLFTEVDSIFGSLTPDQKG